MASITISGASSVPIGQTVVFSASLSGTSTTRVVWYVADARQDERGSMSISVSAKQTPTKIQACMYPNPGDPGASTFSNVIMLVGVPTCGGGEVLNPNTNSCVSTSCGSGFVWNGNTYNCDVIPPPPPPDPTPPPAPTPTPTPTTTITTSTSAQYSGTVGSYYQVQQENTDVFHKDAGDKPKTPELLTFPVVAAGGLLALILFATR
jgi:hypothetical protein